MSNQQNNKIFAYLDNIINTICSYLKTLCFELLCSYSISSVLLMFSNDHEKTISLSILVFVLFRLSKIYD